MNKSVTEESLVNTPALSQFIPAIFLAAVAGALYFLSVHVPPGAVSWAISFVSLAIIIITALARVNDIKIKLAGFRWHLRRMGLVLTGAGAAGVILMGDAPTWHDTMLHVGMALTRFTTPNMPPWWKWIGGKVDADSVESESL